ncbi:MAG: RNA methyltransferase [Bacteroidales bacterium]|nr:RNA methyltransferase [Bacteroidales bacterium]MCF8345354.1 RNA methyltransferase [Bacteroidales bacterium]MCF8352028.1 RNA methyltransferase [Bacteroidales bacterium]MCF8375501.1 RNA methyltransferase [Bacteroidales bacterium]MCF8399900.1 RNA methyltransferase [Bacteroidales bacterium]
MITQNQIKYIRSLQQKKYRREYREFVLEGPKLVKELANSNFKIKMICGTEAYLDNNPALAENPEFEMLSVSPKQLDRISGLKTPNQVLAVAEIPEQSDQLPGGLSGLVLVLDGIQDPGNFGTIIRTADWFGFNRIICSEDTVELYSPKVVQATMGALFRVNVFYGDLAGFLQKQKEAPVMGAFLEGENIFDTSLPNNGFLVIGNESKGISKQISGLIRRKLTIPRIGTNQSESLNASVAAGIFMAEFRRGAFS